MIDLSVKNDAMKFIHHVQLLQNVDWGVRY